MTSASPELEEFDPALLFAKAKHYIIDRYSDPDLYLEMLGLNVPPPEPKGSKGSARVKRLGKRPFRGMYDCS